MKTITEAIRETPIIFDGAMGTVIYGKGVFINTCYDELNLTRPELISEIHKEYLVAGADVLETNTYGANLFKLKQFGLADKMESINRAGVKLAKAAAGENAYVAGSIGPCANQAGTGDIDHLEEWAQAFSKQAEILAKAGVDFFHLETFSNLQELQLAVDSVAPFKLPISACFMVTEEGLATDGHTLEDFARWLELKPEVDIMGLNCGVGPSSAYDTLKALMPIASKPVIVLPNAGLPKDVGGRSMYLTSPEYFAKYAKRFIQLGARGMGGCCGTTPEHISKAVKGIKNLSEVRCYASVKEVKKEEAHPNGVQSLALKDKSRFAKKLAAGELVTSIEVLPPKTLDLTQTFEKIQRCHDRGADAINIPDGPRASARLSNMITGLLIQNKVGIEVIPHFCCRDRNFMAMQGDLMAGYAAGLSNFLLVTGDPPNIGDYPDITGVFDVDSIGLTQMVTNLNRGYDLGGHPTPTATAILIGVAANPCAVDINREIDRFCQKVDAGAEYAITQPVFDADALLEFVNKVVQKNKHIPIIAGVWPLSSFRNAQFMATEVPGVKVPDSVLKYMEKCRTKEENRKAGIELAQATCEKIRSAVQGFQVSAPFGNVDTALKVVGLV